MEKRDKWAQASLAYNAAGITDGFVTLLDTGIKKTAFLHIRNNVVTKTAQITFAGLPAKMFEVSGGALGGTLTLDLSALGIEGNIGAIKAKLESTGATGGEIYCTVGYAEQS